MIRTFIGVSALATIWGGGSWAAAAEPSADALRVRQPTVQGSFYPADPTKLTVLVDTLLMQPPATLAPGRVRAIISPHAGYRYSGVVAAQGFRQIPEGTKRVVVMAPAHRVRMRGGGSILDVDAYRNALGDIPIDSVAGELRDKYGFFASLPKAHQKEHSLEVMLPFLQRRLASFTLIPIVLGQELNAERIAEALLPILDDKNTVLVVSSDLSHDKTYAAATAADRGCLDAILELDGEAVSGKELCGKAPVGVLLEIAKRRSWKPVLIDYRNSGDATRNREARIVGYGCVAFIDPHTSAQDGMAIAPKRPDFEGDPVSSGEQTLLLDLARRSVSAALRDVELPKLPLYSSTLTEKLGCFVTLTKGGKLRGCIGNIFPVHPLVQAVQQNALSAAFKDRRFPKLEESELRDVHFEVSVLTQPVPMAFTDAEDLMRKLKPGIHGVVLSTEDGRRSTYLPQVWDQIPGKMQFLSRLCLKGKMPVNAWRDPKLVRVETYKAFAFGEDEEH